jgi:hypothetical protein
MKLKPIIALLAFTVGAWADEYDGGGDDYGSMSYGSGAYLYERERAEEPRAYIQNGPVTVPVYEGPAISSGVGSGSDFVGATHTLRGSCFSAYGITSCY